MVLSRVQLLDYPRNARLISSHHDKYVFGIEPQAHEIQDNLNMGHALDARAYFILAFHNQHAVTLEHSLCLNGRPYVKFEDCVMPLAAKFRRSVAIGVVVTE